MTVKTDEEKKYNGKSNRKHSYEEKNNMADISLHKLEFQMFFISFNNEIIFFVDVNHLAFL